MWLPVGTMSPASTRFEPTRTLLAKLPVPATSSAQAGVVVPMPTLDAARRKLLEPEDSQAALFEHHWRPVFIADVLIMAALCGRGGTLHYTAK